MHPMAGAVHARSFALITLTALAVLMLAPAAACAEESAALEEILVILKQRGLIDEPEHERLLRKHRAERASAGTSALPAVRSILERLEWSGDLRLRYEGFRYQHDATGTNREDRDRLRYRARLGFVARIDDRTRVGLRVVSGSSNPTSTNQTLGSGDDFDTDDLRLDRAWASYELLQREGLRAQLVGGKIPNPFRWKQGRDDLFWDADISPEGAALELSAELTAGTSLFANLGYFVVDENSTTSDPKLIAGQLGLIRKLEAVELGGRLSGYEWRSLDPDFIGRALANPSGRNGGNLLSAFDGRARIGEASGYFRYARFERWPILLYATLARNFTADHALLGGFGLDDEKNAWLLGLEVGDTGELAKLGFGYGRVEANSLVSVTTDSDLFDGFTNRHGWVVYVRRALTSHTDLNVELFRSEELEDTGAFAGCVGAACGPFAASISDADRYRFRTDVQIHF